MPILASIAIIPPSASIFIPPPHVISILSAVVPDEFTINLFDISVVCKVKSPEPLTIKLESYFEFKAIDISASISTPPFTEFIFIAELEVPFVLVTTIVSLVPMFVVNEITSASFVFDDKFICPPIYLYLFRQQHLYLYLLKLILILKKIH